MPILSVSHHCLTAYSWDSLRTTSENLGEAFSEFGEVVHGNLIFPLAFCIAYYLYFALIWLSNPWRVIDYGFFFAYFS